MLRIRLKNGKEYGVLQNTTIYPSYNSTARSRFEIHMDQSAMSVEDFIAIFDEDAISEIHLVNDEPTLMDVAYFDFVIVASVGLQRVSEIDVSTGKQTITTELVAVLEQLTYIEKQLKALNIEV